MCRLILGRILQDGLGEARQPGGRQGVAAGIKERIAVLFFRCLSCSQVSRSSDIGHAQRVHCWVTAGVQQVVVASGGFMDQRGLAVGVLRVTFKGRIGWSWTQGGAVAICCPQVVLQALHIFRVADSQQLSPLLCSQKGLQDRSVVVVTSGVFKGHGQHRGEDGSWHLGWSWLGGSSFGKDGVEAVGVNVGVAHADGSRLDGGRHHHCGLRLACGLSDAFWIIRISTGLIDLTKVIEVVVECGSLLGSVLVL